jgi:tetratricopeptide (TPR) repeat protein
VADALAEAMYAQEDYNRLFSFLRERAEATKTAQAYLRLARFAMDTNDADTARWAYDQAIEVDAGASVEPYVQAAAFHERVGDIEGAVRRLRQAYGIDPYDPRVSERLRALGEIPGPTIALPRDAE